jgi:squalene synthase HpnD
MRWNVGANALLRQEQGAMTASALRDELAPPPCPAVGSSFYIAMRMLPHPQREAMYALYAFCHAVDDIADGPGPREERLAALERWRTDIDRLYRGEPPAAAAVLFEPTRRFGLRREDFHTIIDGMVMDVTTGLRAPDWETLELYCDRVASAVGRLSVRVFGLDIPKGDALAHHLGRALQLTNILRDLDEDAALDRLYLPRTALMEAAIDVDRLGLDGILSHPGLAKACAAVAARARHHFREADRIMAACPRAAVRAPRLMAIAYAGVLDRLEMRGWAPPRSPVKVSRLRLVGGILRYGLI